MPGRWLGGREDGHAVRGGGGGGGWDVGGGGVGEFAGAGGFADRREEPVESGGREEHKTAHLGGLRVQAVRLSPGQEHTFSWPRGAGGVSADGGGEAAFEDGERFVFMLVDVAGGGPRRGGGAVWCGRASRGGGRRL